MSSLPPVVPEFSTTPQAEAYDRWFLALVQASFDDRHPSIPHDQVMAEMDALIVEAEQRRCRFTRTPYRTSALHHRLSRNI
jgi:hypothetical protein